MTTTTRATTASRYTGLDNTSRCTDCGHLQGQCECPHDCTPAEPWETEFIRAAHLAAALDVITENLR
jgi:hypothetical protein